MKQLFLKSNILHIRTNEGEFVVINPGTIPNSVFPCGWSGGVELIDMLEYKGNMESTRTIKLARLLPQEKKDDIQPKRWEESTSIPSESDYKEEFKPAQPTPNFPKGGTTFTESLTTSKTVKKYLFQRLNHQSLRRRCLTGNINNSQRLQLLN